MVEHRLVIGEVVELGALRAPVASTGADALETRKDIQLGDCECSERVEARRVAKRHEVEPTDSPRAPGRGAVFPPSLPDQVCEVSVDLCGERAGAHARAIGLRHPPDLIDVLGTDAGSDAGSARNWVGRGDERIRPVIDVEQRTLSALE